MLIIIHYPGWRRQVCGQNGAHAREPWEGHDARSEIHARHHGRDVPGQPPGPAGGAGGPGAATRPGPGGRRREVRAAAPRPRPAAGARAAGTAARPGYPLPGTVPLAAWGSGFTVGASILTGIGVVSGVECMIIAHDPTVRGGAMNPFTLKKNLRALDIARVNRLPVIYLVESGGADLPTQSELFVDAGKIFAKLTQLSAARIPTIALVFGNSTAGGAYVPGMCDYAVLVDGQAKVFLGGPPLVKMATGEDADDE